MIFLLWRLRERHDRLNGGFQSVDDAAAISPCNIDDVGNARLEALQGLRLFGAQVDGQTIHQETAA